MDRAFTFGIVTDGSPEAVLRLQTIAATIAQQSIPEYEILIIGNCPGLSLPRTRVIPFDETQRPRWITRKKNLITQHARFEHVVYTHDYVQFEPGWYPGWREFSGFHACMNPILNVDGSRYRDWSLFYDASSQGARSYADVGRFENLIPYTETSLSKLMYFSGAYWVATRTLMKALPLDESLTWGEGEDVIWSHRYRARYDFSINPLSKVRLVGKKKDPIFKEIPAARLEKMKAWLSAHPPEPGYGCSDDREVWRAHGHFGDPPSHRAAHMPAVAGAGRAA